MWNGTCQQIGNWYLVSPMDYNTTLAAGDSVAIGFLAEGEEKDLQLLEKENYFQQTGTKVTSEEERSQAGYTKPEAAETPGPVPTPELAVPEGTTSAAATEAPEPGPVIPIATQEATEPPMDSIHPPKTPEQAAACTGTGTPACAETPGIPAGTPESTGIPGTDIPAVSPTKQPAIPTDIPVLTPEPGPDLTPEVASTPGKEPEPAATPAITDTPEPIQEPARDLVIYTNTTLYEDIICVVVY